MKSCFETLGHFLTMGLCSNSTNAVILFYPGMRGLNGWFKESFQYTHSLQACLNGLRH